MAFASCLQMQMCQHNEVQQFPIPALIMLQPASEPELNRHPLSGREDFPEVSCEVSQVKLAVMSGQG